MSDGDLNIDYNKPDALGAVDDCYARAHALAGDILAAAEAIGAPIARLPEFLTACGQVIEAYDRGDTEAACRLMDKIKRVQAS